MSAATEAKNAGSVALLTEIGFWGTFMTLADVGRVIDPVTKGCKTSNQVSTTMPVDETLVEVCVVRDMVFDDGPFDVCDGCSLVLLGSWSSSGSSGRGFSDGLSGSGGGVPGGGVISTAKGLIPDGSQMKWSKNPNKLRMDLQSWGIFAQPKRKNATP